MIADHATLEDPIARFMRPVMATAAVLLFFTNLDSYAFTAYSTPAPVIWVVLFIAIVAGLVLLEPRRSLFLQGSPLAWWVLLYFALTTIWAFFMRSLPEVSQELSARYRSMAFLMALAVLFDDPRARRAALIAVASCVLLAAALDIAETFSLVTFTQLAEKRIAGRSAGFYLNPNTAGLAIVLGAAVVTEELPAALRVPFLLLCSLGAAATFSRGAVLCMVIVVIYLVWRRALGTWYVVLGAVAASVLLVYGVGILQTNDLLNENTATRLRFAHDDSGRIALVARAWELFLSAPVLGNGIGSTIVWNESVRAHNMFATLAADHGVLGLLAFPAFGLALLACNRRAGCYALVLMVAGFTSHQLLEDRYVLLLSALAAGAASTDEAEPPREVASEAR